MCIICYSQINPYSIWTDIISLTDLHEKPTVNLIFIIYGKPSPNHDSFQKNILIWPISKTESVVNSIKI